MGEVSATALRAAILPEPQFAGGAQAGSGLAAGAARSAARAKTQALVTAVNVLNQSGFVGPGREVTYSTDSSTKQLIIQVVDKQSGDVVVQWPSEYALQMAQEHQKELPNEPLL